ncbi:hypothetical protein, partial [Candidatus Methanoperedens nitratireducens]|uniref:hypothetical protein n=1 Tax=Candidatus Methanoperedens nitratireducens TaxID=1392998 RepID=UPI001C535FED
RLNGLRKSVLKVVHEIRNSSGIVVKKEWERNGTLDAHSSNSYIGYLYVPSWAPADTYTITGSLYDLDSGMLYDNASVDFNVSETNIMTADDWKIDNW